MPIFVRFQGLNEATGTIRDLPPKLEKAVLLDLAAHCYDEAQVGARRHTKPGGTGALFQSLYNRPIPKGREVGHDANRAPHAVFVNLGTRPHVIVGKPIKPRRVYAKPPNKVLGGILRPWYTKTQKTLRWVIGNRFVFANNVNHPGYRGDGYLFAAATSALKALPAILANAIKRAAS